MNLAIPGEIPAYNLPEENVEEPFDAITSTAVAESGQNGPLNENQLKSLLKRLDRRQRGSKRTTEVAQKYTQDIIGVINQLLRLRQRISQIEINEEYLTDCLKGRIKELIGGNEIVILICKKTIAFHSYVRSGLCRFWNVL